MSSGSVTTSTSENTKSTKDRESIMSDVSSVLEDMDVAAMLVRQKQVNINVKNLRQKLFPLVYTHNSELLT